jgi:hypothetical protein
MSWPEAHKDFPYRTIWRFGDTFYHRSLEDMNDFIEYETKRLIDNLALPPKIQTKEQFER